MHLRKEILLIKVFWFNLSKLKVYTRKSKVFIFSLILFLQFMLTNKANALLLKYSSN